MKCESKDCEVDGIAEVSGLEVTDLHHVLCHEHSIAYINWLKNWRSDEITE
jgi:hypothetical protein